ncbi:hypothetical protein N9831_02125 [Amylibacter sp.]|nr:hypothetical protein [Amylibacter sp.]
MVNKASYIFISAFKPNHSEYTNHKHKLKSSYLLLLAVFLSSFSSGAFSSNLKNNTNVNHVLPDDTAIFAPKLRPVNLSTKKTNLIIDEKEKFLTPPTRPKDFNIIANQAKVSPLKDDEITFSRVSKKNILPLKKDNPKINFINKFGSKKRKSALFKNKNGFYQSAKIGQEINGWKILEINTKNIKIQKGLQSEIIRILK